MKSKKLVVGMGIALVLLALLAVLGERFMRTTSEHALQPDDGQMLAVGQKIYQSHCASCHGHGLEGQPNWREPGADGRLPAPPHDASGHTWHHNDELLFRLTKHGVAKAANMPDYKSAMPIYEGVLSDEEIVAVLSWIKSQWPPEIRRQHDQLNARR